MNKSIFRPVLLPILGLLSLILLACTPGLGQSSASEPAVAVVAEPSGSVQSSSNELTPGLRDLNNIEELQILFNQDSGKPRLILLLSPT